MIFYGLEDSKNWRISTKETIAAICFDLDDREEDFKLLAKCNKAMCNNTIINIEGIDYLIEDSDASDLFNNSLLFTLKDILE